MKTIDKLNDLKYALLASATMVAMSAAPANAQATIGETADQLIGQVGIVGRLMVAGAFLGVLVMLATGLFKLKQASENQGQTKYGEGMWRVGVGAALVAIPAFTGMLTATFGFGDSGQITTQGGSSF